MEASVRLRKVMRAFVDYKILLTSQIKDLAFSNSKTCQRWLRERCRQGYLSWFPCPQMGQTGRSERVYYLNPKRAPEIRASLQLPLDQPLTTRSPSNPVKINHHLKINDFIILLINLNYTTDFNIKLELMKILLHSTLMVNVVLVDYILPVKLN